MTSLNLWKIDYNKNIPVSRQQRLQQCLPFPRSAYADQNIMRAYITPRPLNAKQPLIYVALLLALLAVQREREKFFFKKDTNLAYI